MNMNWQYLGWRYYKIQKRVIRAFCSHFYQDTNGDTHNSIMVAGTGRSGTTWLASIIASQIPCRIMFEPFYQKQVQEFSGFHYFHYLQPAEQHSELQSFCHQIFTGNIKNAWIDRQVEYIFPKYRLIKEIRANLLLKWIHLRFPEVPLLFIIRHPCAVVLSRMQLNWATDTDIEPFLSQPHLIDDFLGDKIDIIKQAKTVEEKHAIIWCISNLVPLKQFGSDELKIVFYENLCTQPEVEIPKIFQAIGQSYRTSVFEQVYRPSTTTLRTSAVVTGHSKITHWKTALSPQQIGNILKIVEAFELDHIYRDSVAPTENFLTVD